MQLDVTSAPMKITERQLRPTFADRELARQRIHISPDEYQVAPWGDQPGRPTVWRYTGDLVELDLRDDPLALLPDSDGCWVVTKRTHLEIHVRRARGPTGEWVKCGRSEVAAPVARR